MKRSKTVEIKIDDKTSKNFTVNEMSVNDIIELSQGNELFGGKSKNKEVSTKNANNEMQGFINELQGTSETIGEVIKKTCDFTIEDLKILAPSEIEELFGEWKEVNTSFLSLLEKVGVIEAMQLVLQKAMSDFLRTLAT